MIDRIGENGGTGGIFRCMEETMANELETKDKVIIASGIGGATAAGAIIGSIVPGPGTLIGAGIGAIVGGVGTIVAVAIKNSDE
jgi:hypothetical protein